MGGTRIARMAGSTSTASATVRTDVLTGTHWVGIVAALVSAVVHLVLGVGFLGDYASQGVTISLTMGLSFLVATVGFLVGSWFVLTDRYRTTIYLLGIPFTAGQIVLWYVFNSPGLPAPPSLGPLSAADKTAQIALIAVLVVLYSRES